MFGLPIFLDIQSATLLEYLLQLLTAFCLEFRRLFSFKSCIDITRKRDSFMLVSFLFRCLMILLPHHILQLERQWWSLGLLLIGYILQGRMRLVKRRKVL